jgi:hypothetical protein
MIGLLAEIGRSLISERTRAGVKAAKRRGVKFGRKRKLTPQQIIHAHELIDKARPATMWPTFSARNARCFTGRCSKLRFLLSTPFWSCETQSLQHILQAGVPGSTPYDSKTSRWVMMPSSLCTSARLTTGRTSSRVIPMRSSAKSSAWSA